MAQIGGSVLDLKSSAIGYCLFFIGAKPHISPSCSSVLRGEEFFFNPNDPQTTGLIMSFVEWRRPAASPQGWLFSIAGVGQVSPAHEVECMKPVSPLK
jgi:hypothetical protein